MKYQFFWTPSAFIFVPIDLLVRCYFIDDRARLDAILDKNQLSYGGKNIMLKFSTSKFIVLIYTKNKIRRKENCSGTCAICNENQS